MKPILHFLRWLFRLPDPDDPLAEHYYRPVEDGQDSAELAEMIWRESQLGPH